MSDENEREAWLKEKAVLLAKLERLEKENREVSKSPVSNSSAILRKSSKTGGASSSRRKTATGKVNDPFSKLPDELLEIIIRDAITNTSGSLSALRASSKALANFIDRSNTVLVLGGPSEAKAANLEPDDDEVENIDNEEQVEEDDDDDESYDEEEEEGPSQVNIRSIIYPLWIRLMDKSAAGISTLNVNKKVSWLRFKGFFNHKKAKDRLIASVEEINIRALPNTCRIEDLSPFTKLTKLSIAGCKRVANNLSFALSFPCLTDLNFSGCNKINSLTQLSSLTKLESLSAGTRRLTSLNGLSLLNRLRRLDMTGDVRLSDISALSSLVNLETLILKGCFQSWGQHNFAPLRSLSNLTSLDISSNRRAISHQNAAGWITRLVNLQKLNVSGCTDFFVLTSLTACVNLTSLELIRQPSRHHQNFVNSLAPLSQCLKLESLILNRSTIPNLSDLALCPRIKHVSLPSLDKLSDVSGLLASAGSLEVLDLAGCKAVTTDSLNAVLQAASRLLSLNLSGCANVTRIDLHPAAARKLTTLSIPRSVLHLNFLANLTTLKRLELRTKSIKNLDLLHQCIGLEMIDASECVRVSDLSALANLSLLKDLNLSSIPLQNDEISALGACTSITRLVLRNCSEISNIDFLSGLVKLEELSLHSLTLVQDQYLVALQSLHRLQTLDLRGCINIRDLGPLLPISRTIRKIKMDKSVPIDVKESGGRVLAKVISSQ